MSDFFSEDFFAPLNEDYSHPDRPSLKQLQEQQAPRITPGARAPARVLFEVQNELFELAVALEHADVLKGRAKRDFEDDLDRTYRKLQRYLRSRVEGQ